MLRFCLNASFPAGIPIKKKLEKETMPVNAIKTVPKYYKECWEEKKGLKKHDL